ncbi:MAG: sulfatase [Bryobacter sp.]|nr:sulfatase [Bryobacter sp.]
MPSLSRRALLQAAFAPKRRPNVLLILMDDLGWKDFGCYGSEYYATPNIDALAARSVRFERFYAACPVCSPTRASVLTGKYPVRTGVTDWIPGYPPPKDAPLKTPKTKTELSLSEKTIAEYLRPLGYNTASFGKWHLGGEGFSPTDQGFHRNVGGDHRGSPNRYLAPFTMSGLGGAPAGTELTGYLNQQALHWALEQQRQNQPYFLYLPHFAVHTPLGSLPALIEKHKQRKHINPAYSAMMECVDNAIGELTRSLDLSNTITILTSDNGGIVNLRGTPVTSNAPLREQKGYLYEGGIRVPCLISAPKLKPRVVDRPACSVDLLPTILDLLGEAPPADIDGQPLFGKRRERPYYWHYPHYHGLGGKPGAAVVDGDWKLIEHFEDKRVELFHLGRDAGEKQDLSSREPKRTARLLAGLHTWQKAAGAIFPQH